MGNQEKPPALAVGSNHGPHLVPAGEPSITKTSITKKGI